MRTAGKAYTQGSGEGRESGSKSSKRSFSKLVGDLMRRGTSAHTAVVWLAHIRFIEDWIVGVHAMDNEKYGNVNSGVIAQAFD